MCWRHSHIWTKVNYIYEKKFINLFKKIPDDNMLNTYLFDIFSVCESTNGKKAVCSCLYKYCVRLYVLIYKIKVK